jgi:hyperosmotically inducible protein
MNRRTLVQAALLALAVSWPAVAGAQSKMLEPKTERATDTMKQAAQDAKGAISDSWLTAKTKIALFADERVAGSQVSVETMKGTVMLRGKVDSDAAKAAAESIAKGVEGVKSVKNELQVVPASARKTVKAADADISKMVQSRLSKDPQFAKVDVRSDAGVVILSGEVPTVVAGAKASEIARRVPGVRAVKNDLTYARSGASGAWILAARG